MLLVPLSKRLFLLLGRNGIGGAAGAAVAPAASSLLRCHRSNNDETKISTATTTTTRMPSSSSPTFHVVGDAFVDIFCYLGDGDWPESGGDSVLERPVVTCAGGSSTNTATHLQYLLLEHGHHHRRHEVGGEERRRQSQQDQEARDDAPGRQQQQQQQQQQQPKVILQTVLNPGDRYGQILLDHCAARGLDLVNCNSIGGSDDGVGGHDEPSSTGHCVAIVSRGERSFMTHRGCIEHFEADDIDVNRMVDLDEDLHLHVAGYFNVKGFWDGRLKSVLGRLRAERKLKFPGRRTAVSLVTQHDATNEWDGGVSDLVPFVDFFLMNELEADRMSARGRAAAGSRIRQGERSGGVEEDSAAAVGDWIDYFSSLKGGGEESSTSSATPTAHSCCCFVVTRGAAGAVAFRDGKVVSKFGPAVPTKVVDPTGAGDAFAAGFLRGIWSSPSFSSSPIKYEDEKEEKGSCWTAETIERGLLWGCAVGTAAVTIRGASTPPDMHQILDIYERENANMRELP